MEERAAAVGANLPPTPSKLRQIIADTGSSAAAKATAKIELHRHQKHVQKIVDRAEKEHASMATLLENGPDVSELVAEFKQRGEPFTFGEIAWELRERYYPTSMVTLEAAQGTQAERLCVAGAAYERALPFSATNDVPHTHTSLKCCTSSAGISFRIAFGRWATLPVKTPTVESVDVAADDGV